jgi:hypothetical protein
MRYPTVRNRGMAPAFARSRPAQSKTSHTAACGLVQRRFRVGPQFGGFGELFRAARAPVTGENLVNGLLRHQLASNHYVFDMRNVADINQWIGVEQN